MQMAQEKNIHSRIEELNLISKRTENGKKIAIALEIYNDENSKIANREDTTSSSQMD